MTKLKNEMKQSHGIVSSLIPDTITQEIEKRKGISQLFDDALNKLGMQAVQGTRYENLFEEIVAKQFEIIQTLENQLFFIVSQILEHEGHLLDREKVASDQFCSHAGDCVKCETIRILKENEIQS